MNRPRLSPLVTTLVATLLIAAGAAAPAHADVSPRDRVKVLTAVLNNMRTNYPKFAKSTPGPQDIFDYRIGDLWQRGIDGTGTTVALMEGWADPQINDVVHRFDQNYGLPDPKIRTIYPSGDGKLPAQCPPGMVALGGYGSCDAWIGELRLDVLAAHLVAPYAKILITATPADSEITDDAASQVAPPEIMKAVEYVSRHHLANAISISDGTGESSYSHGKEEITAQDPGELSAAAAGIPLMVRRGTAASVRTFRWPTPSVGTRPRPPTPRPGTTRPGSPPLVAAFPTSARPARKSAPTRSGMWAASPRAPDSPPSTGGPPTRTE